MVCTIRVWNIQEILYGKIFGQPPSRKSTTPMGPKVGWEYKMTKLDDFALQIIGKESPIIEGLGIKESEVVAQHLRNLVIERSSGSLD